MTSPPRPPSASLRQPAGVNFPQRLLPTPMPLISLRFSWRFAGRDQDDGPTAPSIFAQDRADPRFFDRNIKVSQFAGHLRG
jgi:hypothetical protein